MPSITLPAADQLALGDMRTPPPGALPTLSAGSSAGPGESGPAAQLQMNFVANPALDGEGPTLTANALDARHRDEARQMFDALYPRPYVGVGLERDIALCCQGGIGKAGDIGDGRVIQLEPLPAGEMRIEYLERAVGTVLQLFEVEIVFQQLWRRSRRRAI
jgi:hypothetical protein